MCQTVPTGRQGGTCSSWKSLKTVNLRRTCELDIGVLVSCLAPDSAPQARHEVYADGRKGPLPHDRIISRSRDGIAGGQLVVQRRLRPKHRASPADTSHEPPASFARLEYERDVFGGWHLSGPPSRTAVMYGWVWIGCMVQVRGSSSQCKSWRIPSGWQGSFLF